MHRLFDRDDLVAPPVRAYVVVEVVAVLNQDCHGPVLLIVVGWVTEGLNESAAREGRLKAELASTLNHLLGQPGRILSRMKLTFTD